MRRLAASAAFRPSTLIIRLAIAHPPLAVQEQYPDITADRRFYDIARKHPYLSDRVAHVESLRRWGRQKRIE